VRSQLSRCSLPFLESIVNLSSCRLQEEAYFTVTAGPGLCIVHTKQKYAKPTACCFLVARESYEVQAIQARAQSQKPKAKGLGGSARCCAGSTGQGQGRPASRQARAKALPPGASPRPPPPPPPCAGSAAGCRPQHDVSTGQKRFPEHNGLLRRGLLC
jgi:hypothetical protein